MAQVANFQFLESILGTQKVKGGNKLTLKLAFTKLSYTITI